ncbi:Major Facilitator Superfamily (MFS) [Trachipleistophora hominis]|uniref:MFS n=1 Tax=Trachipleistophora hominis TaxID=72359 RepID=L7JVD0_TRAHO|nr:Major Facilitator Superfamily (MFS) [Trachipleistophora hominis]QDQ29473.1 MFS [Trachipleistophora hominis]
MDCRLLSLFMISFFLYASIYAVHNFMFQIVKETGVIDKKKYCLLQLLYIFKFAGVVIFCNLGDRKGIHRYLVAINVVLYSVSILALYNLSSIASLRLRKAFVILTIVSSYIFISGTFPLLDSLTYNYLEHEGLDVRQSGRVRMGGALGNMFVQVVCSLLQYCFSRRLRGEGTKNRENVINISCNLFFSAGTALIALLFAPNYVLGKKVIHAPKKAWKVKKIFTDLISLLNPLLVLYTLAVLGQGIDRAGISTFLSKYLENKGIERSYVHVLFFCRCIPEILIYGLSQQIESVLGMNTMFLLSVIISSSRSFFYSSYNFNNSPGTLKAITVIAEIFKGFYSSFFNYCGLRIFRSFATDDTLSLAQGIFNGTYNALSYFTFAFLGYFLVDYEKAGQPDADEDIRHLFFVVACISCVSIIAPIVAIVKRRLSRKEIHKNNELQPKPAEIE